MSFAERLPAFVWRASKYLPPRLAYAIGLGDLVGRRILLLTTTGRVSGRPRVTPLLYDEIEGALYVGSARGERADWVRNLRADPNVVVQIGSRTFKGHAELITDPVRIADFLELRRERHPLLAGTVMWAEGLREDTPREKVEAVAATRALVVIEPGEELQVLRDRS